MTTGLSVSDVVNVSVNLAPLAAATRNFGAMMVVGSSDVIDTTERIRLYTSIAAVAADFGTSAPEYKASLLHFSQSPQPSILYIGRYAAAATEGRLNGAILSSGAQAIANFTAVTSGAMTITVDGVPMTLSGLNFGSAGNLNAVASTLQTAIQANVASSLVKWDSASSRFSVFSPTTGTSSSVSVAQAPTAVGHMTFGVNPTASDTVTFNGVAITFETSGATGNQVNIGVDLATTLTSLAAFLNASPNTSLNVAKYTATATKLYVEYLTPGTGGNSYTLAASAATPSASTLAGGAASGDCSTLLGLTTAAGATTVAGIGAETPDACIAILANQSNDWYGCSFATSPALSNNQHLAVAAFIEAESPSRIYACTTQETAALDANATSDLAYLMKNATLERTLVQYSSGNPYAAASILGRISTVNFNGSNTTLTVKFKQEPGITSESLTESQAAALQGKNCNVFVKYQNGTAILQEGKMANGYFIDEVHGTDWLQNAIQTNVWNTLYTSPTKIPQTDDGTHILVTVVEATMSAAVNNGLVAPGVWNAPGFGQLKQGDVLSKGFYVFAPPVATQSQADREARKSVPIQVAAKLAGAIHSVNVIVSVNR